MRAWGYVLASLGLLNAGCAFQRAEIAQEAQHKMVGLTKEEVLRCMGPPAAKMAEGAMGFRLGMVGSSNSRVPGVSGGTARAPFLG
jgi:hypothetical protein